jgi:hypothetical protein
MKTCPHCRQQIPVEAKDCKFCHQPVVRKCPHCAEEIYYGARICRYCSQDVSTGAPPPPPPPAGGPVPPTVMLRQLGPVGEERNILVWVLIALFGACIGPAIWIWQMGADINRHGGRERVNPTMDLVLLFVTCGFWGIYLFWKYAEEWNAIVKEEGGELRTDLPMLCLILGFFLPIVAMVMLQSEMNEHWKRHPANPAAPPPAANPGASGYGTV